MIDLQHRRATVHELGTRVVRELVMENTGSGRRRRWWIASSAALAFVHGKAA